MNISAISFKGVQDNNFDIPEWVNSRHPQNNRNKSSLEREPQTDTYCARKRTQRHPKKKSIIPTPVKSFAAGVLATLTIGQTAAVINQPSKVVEIPVNSSTSLSEVADMYDSDVNAILDYNDLTEDSDLSQQGSISVPSSYNCLQEKIDELQEKLYNDNLSANERAEIEDKLASYKEKQKLQNSIASVYTDGKYVYFTIIDVPDSQTGSINVERFKNIFDIEDGALRKYNNLDYTWAFDPDAPEYDNGYRDYTVATLHVGDTVKVRSGNINAGD